ncbi:MAG: prepilin-type N-terminal cleavage/methylation domain-containing protein [Candidatus Taylorbacteria bacterium]
MKFLKSSKRGFTLIELLVVISIVSMLASVVLATVNPMRAQARDAKRKQEVHQVDLAIQSYIADNGRPPELSGCAAQISVPTSVSSGCIAVSTASISSNPSQYNAWQTLKTQLAPYMKNLPVDPCGSNCTTAGGTNLGYVYLAPAAVQYYSGGSNTNYQVSANLETSSSPSSGNTGTIISDSTLVAPSIPGNPAVSSPAFDMYTIHGPAYKVTFSWSASTVGSGGSTISGYVVYFKNVPEPMTSNTYLEEQVTAPGPWCWTVSAVDNMGHYSAQTSPVCTTVRSIMQTL